MNVTELSDMQDRYLDGESFQLIYEQLLNIKVNEDLILPMMCSKCLQGLEKVFKFVNKLKNIHLKLEEAAIEISNLNKDSISDYIQNKQVIIRNFIKYNGVEVKMEETLIKNEKLNREFSVTESSDGDDDGPLVDNVGKIINLSSKLKNKKKTENAETGLVAELSEMCPICSKKTRNPPKHLETVHFINWINCACLKCSFQANDREALIKHYKECNEDKFQVYITNSSLKEESPFGNDSDFELDDSNVKESEDESEDLEDDEEDLQKKKVRHRRYVCKKCDNVKFATYEDIESHLKQVHSEESKCILCKQESSNPFGLLYHMMVKHGKLKCCRLCLISFKNSDQLNAHYKSDEHNTKCGLCGKQFEKRKALYEHRRKKHLHPQSENQRYKCPECPKEFANSNNIRRHIMVAHNDLRFLCDTCGQSYTTKRNLRLHIQKFHEGIKVQTKTTKKNFFCESCGRELKIFHKYAIAMHRAKHKGHNFVCKKCYDSFVTEKEFRKHVQEFEHQLFECDKCSSQFVREENLKLHLKNHEAPGWNKNMYAKWGKSALLRNEKGEFQCSYCPKVFKDKQRLDNHVRVHTNERPYKCHICSKGFKTWIHRKTHLNIHLGIKKWTCKYCSKSFTNSSTLKGHEMIHTGERPHHCPECRKGFITSSAMKKHRMIHLKRENLDFKKEKRHIRPTDRVESDVDHSSLFYNDEEHLFSGSDVHYESFCETSKEPSIGLISIEKELPC
ncbi:hypothetical protein ABEB36_012107 [Hypothenemus hampei]|uniref:C2H2-type domain-containing protein n=1 Tax=Hypothenemus hampei TaxID=57062 RepID=A0ABD1EA56_HYPHA